MEIKITIRADERLPADLLKALDFEPRFIPRPGEVGRIIAAGRDIQVERKLR